MVLSTATMNDTRGIYFGVLLILLLVNLTSSVNYIEDLVVKYNEARQKVKEYMGVDKYVRHLHYDFFLWQKVAENLTCAMEPGPNYRFFRVPADNVTATFEHEKHERVFAEMRAKRWEEAFRMLQGSPFEAMVFTQRWLECRQFNCTEQHGNVTLTWYYACAINPIGKLTKADFFQTENTTTTSLTTSTSDVSEEMTDNESSSSRSSSTEVPITESSTTSGSTIISSTIISSTVPKPTESRAQNTEIPKTTTDEFDDLLELPSKSNGAIKRFFSLVGFAFLMLLLLWFTIYE